MKSGKYEYKDNCSYVVINVMDRHVTCIRATGSSGWKVGETGSVRELNLSEWRLIGDSEIDNLREQLAKANERVIDSIIEPLFKARWSGDLSDAQVSEMRDQLFKTLRDQTVGYWSGHTAYNIAVDGGFLVNDKKGANKRLTSLGAMFVEQEQLRKGQE